jgi:RND family efflux transporter MFP subunit
MESWMRDKMPTGTVLALAALALLGSVGCDDPADHPHAVHHQAETGGGGAVTLWTGSTELFLEYPALVVDEPAKLVVHLTALSDFAPIRSGVVSLRFEPEDDGDPVEVVQEAPHSPGVYGLDVVLPRAESWNLRLSIVGPQVQDSFVLRGLRSYAHPADLPEAGPGVEDAIVFLKEQQWQTPGFGTALAEEGSLPSGIDVPGEIVPAAGRYAEVSAPVDGLVDPEGASVAPAPGQTVERGQILAVVTPALGDSGSALAAARAELRQAEQDHARAKRLLEVEAVPKRRLDEARIRLDAARESLAGLAGGDAVGPDGRIRLRSPITGVVALRDLAPGSRVEAGEQLFVIVDPSLVWLRAHVPAADAARIGANAGASFMLEGGATHETARTVAVGSMVDEETRSVAVLYEVENPKGSIKLGAHARVRVRTGEVVQGVLVPDSALLEEDGRPIAYVQQEGERFERRELALGPRSGGLVLVRGGIASGERVVSGGPYRVRLASLIDAAPAHGH